jgi:hypothetical protein
LLAQAAGYVRVMDTAPCAVGCATGFGGVALARWWHVRVMDAAATACVIALLAAAVSHHL